jgi:hypothetical protein
MRCLHSSNLHSDQLKQQAGESPAIHAKGENKNETKQKLQNLHQHS